jgi:uncharacterized protein with FMN-binding domain
VRRITTAIVATISGVALLFSYHTSTSGSRAVASAPGLVLAAPDATGTAPSATAQQPATDAAPAATTDPPPATTDQPPAATTGSGSASAQPKVVDGDAIDTRWGPVQVQVTVASGKITDVQPITVPYDRGKSVEINNYAVPILRQEIIDAQSAQIDTVSGATYTSDGYRGSLQSALDKVGFGS